MARTRLSEQIEEIENDVASLHEADKAAEILLLRVRNPADRSEIWIIRQAIARVQQRAGTRRAQVSPKRSHQGDSPLLSTYPTTTPREEH